MAKLKIFVDDCVFISSDINLDTIEISHTYEEDDLKWNFIKYEKLKIRLEALLDKIKIRMTEKIKKQLKKESPKIYNNFK